MKHMSQNMCFTDAESETGHGLGCLAGAMAA
jgi:hypothetical protein